MKKVRTPGEGRTLMVKTYSRSPSAARIPNFTTGAQTRLGGSGLRGSLICRGIAGQGDDFLSSGESCSPNLPAHEGTEIQSLVMPYKLTAEIDSQFHMSENQGDKSTPKSMDKS